MALKIFFVIIFNLINSNDSSEWEYKRLILDDQSLGTQYTIQRLESQIQQLKAEEQQRRGLLTSLSDQLLKLTTGGCGGILFEHWGNESCPPNTAFVYSGYAGGSHYSHAGGSAETLCMPKDPIMGSRTAPSSYGMLYGTEYETNFFGTLSSNEDVPCAVCISHQSTIKIMIPGRNRCYAGWNELYHGYLAGNYYNNAGSENFICMSEHPEFLFGGKADLNGRAFYGVISTCGSLQCPPYNESVPLTCVVCGK